MDKRPQPDFPEVLKTISSIISNCEKLLPKFDAGSSQNSLLQNRLQAMYISKALVQEEDVGSHYSKEDLEHALRPIDSIIHKCKAGQAKYAVENSTFVRLQKIIDAMIIAQMLIQAEIRTKS